MQPTIFDQPVSYTSVMRQKRIATVMAVLEEYPVARDDMKELLLLVWIKQLDGQDFIPTNIRRYCSSPSSIDRDRRRPATLEKYPRKDDKADKMREYKDEFSPQAWSWLDRAD